MMERGSSNDETVKGLMKFVNFLQISRGSCSEVRSMLYLCVDRHVIDQETFKRLKAEAVSISNQLYRLIESIAKGPKKP